MLMLTRCTESLIRLWPPLCSTKCLPQAVGGGGPFYQPLRWLTEGFISSASAFFMSLATFHTEAPCGHRAWKCSTCIHYGCICVPSGISCLVAEVNLQHQEPFPWVFPRAALFHSITPSRLFRPHVSLRNNYDTVRAWAGARQINSIISSSHRIYEGNVSALRCKMKSFTVSTF